MNAPPPIADDAATAAAGVHLTFLPEWAQPRFLLWGEGARDHALSAAGEPASASLLDERLQRRDVSGYALSLTDALRALAALPADELPRLPSSIAVWSLASKLVLELVARERIVPRIVNVAGDTQARFGVALSQSEDAERVARLAKSFPLAAHAVPIERDTTLLATARKRNKTQPEAATYVWSGAALLAAFLDMSADAVLRAAMPQPKPSARKRGKNARPELARDADGDMWQRRWIDALTQSPLQPGCAQFIAEGFAERRLLDELQAWAQPALGGAAGLPHLSLRLELPESEGEAAPFRLRFFLQAHDDPSVLVPAQDVYAEAESLRVLHCDPQIAGEQFLKSLAVSARIFAPIAQGLKQARPDSIELNADGAAQFLNAAAPALSEAGIGVLLPGELTAAGQRRLRMRMRVGGHTSASGGTNAGGSHLSREQLALEFTWEAEIDGERLSAEDLAQLAALKAPLVRFRGRWVAVDRDELRNAQKLLAQGGGKLSRAAALAAAMGGDAGTLDSELPVSVIAEGELSKLIDTLETRDDESIPVPPELHGTLRPYQQRGLGWLAMMDRLHLGACLADDMGLGKTIQLLAFLLHRRQHSQGLTLLICPTSVIGNWQRELARFAPSLPVRAHYGPMRVRAPNAFADLPDGAIVLTSYGLLRRDAALFGEIEWSVAVLDEAQNIKNAGSRTARAARTLHAQFRVALTGTPVENGLTELWSISEFLNPGLLGSFEGFRREIAIPIERFAREDIAIRLKQIVRPFILRRVKSDPTVIQDLPAKQEMTVYCSLTREQASLYQAALDSALEGIESSDGIERRGQVLALITALKQICNHPAQYLREAGPLGKRSGKLERLREMLEEALAAGDRVLVFTQYREMGERLVRDLSRHFGDTVQYLHGGTPRATRDAMIKRFQEDRYGPQIFVLSLKAGGTGLNLTAATHVFHYDRWWNPAVEDQATDRAYRIGQQRNVQVHKFLCAGTIEERVAQMLESKRDLAARIVGQGEQCITELSNVELRELFSLAPNAVLENDEADSDATAPPKPRVARRKHAVSSEEAAP
jgi:hypothetical protein